MQYTAPHAHTCTRKQVVVGHSKQCSMKCSRVYAPGNVGECGSMWVVVLRQGVHLAALRGHPEYRLVWLS